MYIYIYIHLQHLRSPVYILHVTLWSGIYPDISIRSGIYLDLLYPVKPCIKEFCSVIYLVSLTTVLISIYQSKDDKYVSPAKKSKVRIVSEKRSFHM